MDSGRRSSYDPEFRVDDALLDRAPGPIGSGVEDDPRLVVETLLGIRQGAAWRVFLLRRTPSRGGFWQGVSGRVEPNDESLRDAALREIREETGIGAGVVVFDLGRWIEYSGRTGIRYRKRILGAVLPKDASIETVRLSEEHDRAEIVTFDEARRRAPWSEAAEEFTALEAALALRSA